MITGGEVGELTPLAYVTPVGRGYVIEMHSGMMRLVYSAIRAIVATDDGRYRQHNTPALSGAQAVEKIAELFAGYKAQKIATAQAFPITDGQQRWANTIAVHAETFLLMHELAHVYNEHVSWPRRLFRKTRKVYDLEVQADSTASQWLIDYLLNPKPDSSQPQMFYAGAEFGLRIRMAMETVGFKFKKTHPPAGDRITALRARLRATAGPRAFYALANTSLAYDQMWRGVERMLLGQPSMFDLTVDDVLSSMRTLVVELLQGSEISDIVTVRQVAGESKMEFVLAPKEQRKIAILNSAPEYMRHVSLDVRDSARAHAHDVFEPGSVEFGVLLVLLNT